MGHLLTSQATRRRQRLWRTYAKVYDHIWDAPPATHVADHVCTSLGQPDGVILDIGAGTGLVTGPLTHAGWNVIAVDYQPAMLTAGRAHGRIHTAILADAAHLPFADASIDHVVAVNLLHLVDDPHRVLTELARILKPAGTATLVYPNPRISLLRTAQVDHAAGRPAWPTLTALLLRWGIGLLATATNVASHPDQAHTAIAHAATSSTWHLLRHQQPTRTQMLVTLERSQQPAW